MPLLLITLLAAGSVELQQPIRGAKTTDDALPRLTLELSVSSTTRLLDTAELHYRTPGATEFRTAAVVRPTGGFGFLGTLDRYYERIEYFLVLQAENGEKPTIGSPDAPLALAAASLKPLVSIHGTGKGVWAAIGGGVVAVATALIAAVTPGATGPGGSPDENTPDLSGSWSGSRGAIQTTVILTQTHTALSGHYHDDQGIEGDVLGAVAFSSVSFTVNATDGTRFSFEGHADDTGQVLTGRCMQNGPTVDWTLRRQAP